MTPEHFAQAATNFELFDRAAADSVRSTVLHARKEGWPLVIERDGQIINLPADEFVLPGEELGPDGKVRSMDSSDAAPASSAGAAESLPA